MQKEGGEARRRSPRRIIAALSALTAGGLTVLLVAAALTGGFHSSRPGSAGLGAPGATHCPCRTPLGDAGLRSPGVTGPGGVAGPGGSGGAGTPGTPAPPSGLPHLPGLPPLDLVHACAGSLCDGTQSWTMYGATVFNPGLRPEQSGFLNPAGTIALARSAHLNTIRLINFYPNSGDPTLVPFEERSWQLADQMIAAAGAAGMHVELGLGDYRNTLWNDCVNPYTYDWTRFIQFVATRRNTVSGAIYGTDPTIAFVSISGEPLPVGSHSFTARTTGRSCTISYTTNDLTEFYVRTLSAWKAMGPTVMVNSGGLGYINEYRSGGIDWKSIFALPDNDFCDIKTYGGMLGYAGTPAQYCHAIGKPIIDEEFGWQQSDGDAKRAQEFTATMSQLNALGFSGAAFWNLGYQVTSTSYDVSTRTPRLFAAIQRAAP